jgi:hypothetical protein
MFTSIGTIVAEDNFRVALDVEKELVRYYLSFVPKNLTFNKPKFSPHITIVRGKFEVPNKDCSFLNGRQIEFSYSNQIKMNDKYLWIPAYSEELQQIRSDLGLDWCYDKEKGFHITIGNFK